MQLIAITESRFIFGKLAIEDTNTIHTNQGNEKVISRPLAKILSEGNTIRILKSASSSFKSAHDLSMDCQVSLTTIYRQIKRLNDMKLLAVSGSIDVSGKKHFTYKSKETIYCKCACSHIDLSDLLGKEIH